MKKLILGLCLVTGVGMVSYGQQKQKNDYPYRAISKDVQRIQIKSDWYEPASITTGDAAAVSGKGISRIHAKPSARSAAQVQMNGTPSWIISKGVARMQYEKNNKTNE
jgi:hypothetical protein